MTRILLFCTAEEAKPFVRKALNVKDEGESDPSRMFYLVESRVCPSYREGFKLELKDDETFETDFIGASTQDCQEWALEKQFQVNFIEQDIIAIADTRSAEDDTLLIQDYVRELRPPERTFKFEGFGVLPRKYNTWNDFRIDYKEAAKVHTDLVYGPINDVYPIYYGRKEELTDERGVFNVAKAARLIIGEDTDTPQA